jgi:iron complex transport system ATP-binding protein
MLEARQVEFNYLKPVLRGVSLTAGAGDLLALLGPNGSGKSTLLRIIVGILKPTGGSVTLSGRDVGSLQRRELARMIGYVAQESVVRFPLTAMEYVLQGRFAQGRLVGFESERDVDEAEWAMRMTATTEFATRNIQELSGGERQRVMLARAIASRPRLLVLDEPVANLDIAQQVRTFDLVRALTREEGMAAVVVTHELNLAAEFASAALLLKSGRAMAYGATREVMTEGLLKDLFETDLTVDENPSSGAPRITLRIRPARGDQPQR